MMCIVRGKRKPDTRGKGNVFGARFLRVCAVVFSLLFSVETLAADISGTVFEDIYADLLADGSVGDSGNPGMISARVRLFDNAGVAQETQSTLATGAYTFTGVAAGTYYVSVDAPQRTAAGTLSVLGEQTYASAGTGNTGLAGGAGYGPLCVLHDGNYTQQTDFVDTNIAQNPASGACYSGRRGQKTDHYFADLDSNEHVTRIVVGTNDISGVDFGFSFNVVTGIKLNGQGTVHQFVDNANTIPGPNAMRFVPSDPPNMSSGISRWWRVRGTSIRVLEDDDTSVDGKAYSYLDGATEIDINPVMLGSGGTVGVDALSLPRLNGPELEIQCGFAVGSSVSLAGHRAVFRNLALNKIALQQLLVRFADGVVIENNLFGTTPDSYTAADGGAGLRLATAAPSNGLIVRNNLFFMGNDDYAAIHSSDLSTSDAIIEGNEIRRIVNASNKIGAVYLDNDGGLRGNSVIRGNLIDGMRGPGVYDNTAGSTTDSQGLLIENNTISNIDRRGNTRDAVYVNVDASGDASPYSIRRNVFSDNGTQGSSGSAPAGVALGNSARSIKISQNSFSGNRGNAIDLGNNGVSGNANVCQSLATNGSNHDLGRPSLVSANVGGSSVEVSATFCDTGSYTFELYRVPRTVSEGDGLPQAGEGDVFLGSASGLSGGSVSGLMFNLDTGILVLGDKVSAIVIREDGSSANSTSEFSANISVTQSPFDYGDAPDSYGTTLASDGARHWVGIAGAPWLGRLAADADDGTLTNINAKADDLDNLSDEEGVILPERFDPGHTASMSLRLGGGSGYLNIWFDWNADGDFLDGSEHAVIDALLTPGPIVMNLPVPSSAISSMSYARFRTCSTAGNCNTPLGEAADGEVEDYRIRIGDLISITGTAFEDNGRDGGLAHNGIRDGGEVVLSGLLVTAKDVASGTLLETATTGADGAFEIALPTSAANKSVQVAIEHTADLLPVSETVGSLNGLDNPSSADGRVTFVPLPAQPVDGLDFGYIHQPVFVRDQEASIVPGGAVLYRHYYTATTEGSVDFTIANAIASPNLSVFSHALFWDADCSGSIEGSEGPLAAAIPVAADDEVCLIARVQTASGAPAGAQLDFDLTAQTDVLNTSAVLPELDNHDKTSITDFGQLDLTKSVRNVTMGESFSSANAGSPGDILEYRIVFKNQSSTPISNIALIDRTAAYTRLSVPPGASVGSLPSGLSCVVGQPATQSAGYGGDLLWNCAGVVNPGEQGEVFYQVKIDE